MSDSHSTATDVIQPHATGGGHGEGHKAILAAFFANLGIAIAKGVGFTFTGSASLMAETIHSLADATNQGLLMLGRRKSRRLPTDLHPFGYGAERYFWAFVVAMLLFGMGGLFSLVEGFEKFRHPHEPESLAWAVGILSVAIVFEIFSLRIAVLEAAAAKGKLSWGRFIRQAKSPELPVVLLEDIGALFGLVLALMGVITASVTGDGRYDAMGSLAIGILLVVIAAVLAKEMKSLLIGEAADDETVAKIRSALLAAEGISEVRSLRTLLHGPDGVLMDATVVADGDELQRNHAMESAEQSVRASVPIVKLIDLNSA